VNASGKWVFIGEKESDGGMGMLFRETIRPVSRGNGVKAFIVDGNTTTSSIKKRGKLFVREGKGNGWLGKQASLES
jgi:hypothetical protein